MKRFPSYLLSSSLLLSVSCTTQALKREISSVDTGMEYVNVCKSEGDCRKFSRLIMGTDHLVQGNWTGNGDSEMNEEQMREVLDEAARLGINTFDTSPIYVGGVEYKLGRWVEARKRDAAQDSFYPDARLNPDRQLYVISKGGFPFDLYYSKKLEKGNHSSALKKELKRQGIVKEEDRGAEGESVQLQSPPPGTYASRLYGSVDQIKERVSEELGHTTRNLNNDVTIYLMHRDDGDYVKFNEVRRKKTPVLSIMEALSDEEMKKKYWMIGWSNWQTDRVNESLKLAGVSSDLSLPVMNSPYFSLFEMTSRTIHAGGVQVTHQEMQDPNFQKGIRMSPYSPLGGFSILDKPAPCWENARKDAKKKYDQGDAYWMNVYHSIFTTKNQKRYERVVAFTKKFNQDHGTDYTVDQMINAYALAHKRMDFLTIGPRTVEQLRRTVQSLKLANRLTDEDLEYLYSGK